MEEQLEDWLEEGYAVSFRTACLILGNRADAEEAVQDAYLRAWRFRDSLTSVPSIRPWLYRVVVNSCYSKLRQEIPHRDRRAGDEPLAHVPAAAAAPRPAPSSPRWRGPCWPRCNSCRCRCACPSSCATTPTSASATSRWPSAGARARSSPGCTRPAAVWRPTPPCAPWPGPGTHPAPRRPAHDDARRRPPRLALRARRCRLRRSGLGGRGHFGAGGRHRARAGGDVAGPGAGDGGDTGADGAAPDGASPIRQRPGAAALGRRRPAPHPLGGRLRRRGPRRRRHRGCPGALAVGAHPHLGPVSDGGPRRPPGPATTTVPRGAASSPGAASPLPSTGSQHAGGSTPAVTTPSTVPPLPGGAVGQPSKIEQPGPSALGRDKVTSAGP